MIFNTKNEEKPNSKLVLTEIRRPKGNLLVVLNIDYKQNGIEITNIDSIHDKYDSKIREWIITDDNLIWADKEKSVKWLQDSAASNSPQQVAFLNAYIDNISQQSDKVKSEREKNTEVIKNQADKIRLATGWYQDKDGKWKYEISDEDIIFLPAKEGNEYYTRKIFTDTLDRIIKHPTLFKLYPELKNIEVRFTSGMLDNQGVYYPSKKTIEIFAPKKLNGFTKGKQVIVLLHEIQHAIQDIEGFARGGNVVSSLSEDEKEIEKLEKEWRFLVHIKYEDAVRIIDYPLFNNKMSENDFKLIRSQRFLEIEKKLRELRAIETNFYEKYNKYQKLLGEMEARETAYRAVLTAEQRKNLRPYQIILEKEGIDVSEAIIKFEDGDIQQSIKILDNEEIDKNENENTENNLLYSLKSDKTATSKQKINRKINYHLSKIYNAIGL